MRLTGGCCPFSRDVGDPSPCAPEALAGRAGGQQPIPRPGVDRPRGHALQDPVETRHATHAAARGRGHHIQGEGSHVAPDVTGMKRVQLKEECVFTPRQTGRYCSSHVDARFN